MRRPSYRSAAVLGVRRVLPIPLLIALGCGEGAVNPMPAAGGAPSAAAGSGRTITTVLKLTFTNATVGEAPGHPVPPDIGGPLTAFPAVPQPERYVKVVASEGPLVDKPVVLHRDPGADVVLMNAAVAGTPPSAGVWVFRVRTTPQSGNGAGTIEIHGGEDGRFVIQRLAFSVDVETGARLIYTNDGPVATWEGQHVHECAVTIDLDRQRTTVAINGVVVARNVPFGHPSATTLHSVVFSMWDGTRTTRVAHDDISIIGSVPPGRAP